MAASHAGLSKMIRTRSFAAGVILAVALMLLAHIYSAGTVPGPDLQTLSVILFMAGLYSGYHLGTAIREGGESTYFLVGLTVPIVTTVFVLVVVSSANVAALMLPLGFAFSTVFLNSGTISDQKTYVRFIGSIAKYFSQFAVLTVVFVTFVSPVTATTIKFTIDSSLAGAFAIILTAAEWFLRNRANS